MSTSFAWVVRGEFRQAFRVNAAGALAALAGIVAMPVLLVMTVTGRDCGLPKSPHAGFVLAGLWLLFTGMVWLFNGVVRLPGAG
jgi:hypothetical protein